MPADCKEVMCAMKNLYGEELGIQILYMRAKFGLNSSHLGVGEGDAWKPQDLGVVLAMLGDFPSDICSIEEGTRFVHINAGGKNGDKIIAESLVHVYLGWHNLNESERTTSLAHELVTCFHTS